MKTILKLISGLLLGIAGGLVVATIGIVLFTDLTLSEYIDKFMATDALEGVSAALVGGASFIVALAILIPAHEAGHLVCGLLTGYKFVSFRIFNLTFIRVNDKIRVKKYSVAGTGGQCLLTPPDLPVEEIPTAWYNAGGVLANLALLVLTLPLFLLDLHPFVAEFLVIFCLTDVLLILTNGIPMKVGGISNDGYNIIYLNRNLLSKQSIVTQLRSNALIQEGVRPKDMPAEWHEWKGDIDYKNPLEVSMPLMHASRLVDEMRWEEAYQEFSHIYGHKADIMQLYVKETACELAFCALVTGRKDQAAELLDKNLRKYINAYRGVMSSKQRIMCAIELYLNDDRAKATEIYEALDAASEKYLLQGEVKSDLSVMKEMLEQTQSPGTAQTHQSKPVRQKPEPVMETV